jgi:hypothetical protein
LIEFLSPVSKSVVAHCKALPDATIGKQIGLHSEEGVLPDLRNSKFAIIGCKENRRAVNFMGDEVDLAPFRKEFYALYPGNWKHGIVDLGDIEKGDTVEDSYFALKTVSEALIKKQIIPLILGASQDAVYAQYRAFDALSSMLNLVNVDSRFDIGDADKPINNKSYVGRIIVNEPYNLFNYSVLGYQSYFNPPQEIALMETLFFDAYRMGQVINDIKVVEPIMRNADIVTIDATAIKSSELGFITSDSPNGFDGREICSIARYAGISNKVRSFSIFELGELTASNAGGLLIAQVLWYFVEGVNFRVHDDGFDDENCFITYKVPVKDEILTFKKSSKTGRWWIELPFISNLDNKLKSRTLLPCTYGEYVGATNQEVPERWLKARHKNEI